MGRQHQARCFIYKWIAQVDMLQKHMRGRGKSLVFDAIFDPKSAAIQRRPDAPV
jgi:hypothetical protein